MKEWLANALLAMIAVLGAVSYSHAGSDRFVMSMSAERMERENLVFVRFLGPDGAALESDVLEQMIIRERDCSSGRVLKMVKDYRMGYAPKSMLVGIYLDPHAWSNDRLCFTVPGMGMIGQSLNPASGNGRSFQLKVVP